MPTPYHRLRLRSARPRGSVVALLAAWLFVGHPAGGGETAAEDVKLAFLFNFAKFTEWPEPAPATEVPFVIGILGEWPAAAQGEGFGGRTVHGRKVQIVRLGLKDDLRSCQVLLLHNLEPREVAHALEAVRSVSVLTVGDSDEFLDEGGIIRFVMEGMSLRFEVHLENAATAHLKLNSGLLALANKVRGRRSTP